LPGTSCSGGWPSGSACAKSGNGSWWLAGAVRLRPAVPAIAVRRARLLRPGGEIRGGICLVAMCSDAVAGPLRGQAAVVAFEGGGKVAEALVAHFERRCGDWQALFGDEAGGVLHAQRLQVLAQGHAGFVGEPTTEVGAADGQVACELVEVERLVKVLEQPRLDAGEQVALGLGWFAWQGIGCGDEGAAGEELHDPAAAPEIEAGVGHGGMAEAEGEFAVGDGHGLDQGFRGGAGAGGIVGEEGVEVRLKLVEAEWFEQPEQGVGVESQEDEGAW